MVKPVYKACKECHRIYENAEGDTCFACGGQLTKEWQGLITVIDYTKSDIAKQMGISENGRYALKVR